MLRIVYSSSARSGMDAAMLNRILGSARVRNARRDISGMLLYRDGVFLQLLEGREVDVRYVFDRITVDPRHKRLVKLVDEPITERDFAGWHMGYRVVTAADIASAEPAREIIHKPLANFAALELNPPAATRLVLSFARPLGISKTAGPRLAIARTAPRAPPGRAAVQ